MISTKIPSLLTMAQWTDGQKTMKRTRNLTGKITTSKDFIFYIKLAKKKILGMCPVSEQRH